MICKIEKSLENLGKNTDNSARSLTTPDWITLSNGTVLFDTKTNSFQCVIELETETPNSLPLNEFQKLVEKGLKDAQEFIFGFYNKKKISNVIAEVVDQFIPVRPNPSKCPVFGMKILVAIKKENLDAIPFDEDQPEQEELPIADREILFISKNLSQRINDLADTIEEIQRDVEKFDGKVIGINLAFESKLVRQFDSALRSLFLSNGRVLRTNEEDIVILGISNDFKILYVLNDNGSGLKWLKIGFDLFRITSSASNKRTISYVEQMAVLEEKTNIDWMLFLQQFTFDPPQILLKGKEKISPKISDKSVKTEEEMLAEEDALLEPNFKATLISAAEVESEFVGDQAIGNLTILLDEISNLEDVYGQVLNKVGLKSIVKQAIQCLTDQLPLEEVQKILAIARLLAQLINAPCERFIPTLKEFGFSLEQITPFRVAIHREIRNCVNGFRQEAKFAFFDSVKNISGININVIEDLEKVPVDQLISLPEIDGERIVNLICDTERNSVVEFLSAFGLPIPDLFVDLQALLPSIIPLTIQFFDNLPTVDIMAAIAEQVFQAILDALTAAIVEMVKGILQEIVNNCGDLNKVNFGDVSFDRLIANTVGELEGSERFQDAKSQLIGNIALVAHLGTIPETIKAVGGLIDDVSTVLTPNEFSQLLNGNPSNETNKLVNCLVSSKYANELKPTLGNNSSKINNLFISVGKVVNKNELIDEISKTNVVKPLTLENCEFNNDDVRCQLLSKKGLTPAQCEEQLKKAKARKIQRLTELANLLERDDVLDNVLPSICGRPGFISKDPPSFTFLLDKILNSIYEGTLMTFDQEINGFVQAISEPSSQTEKQKVVLRKKKVVINGEEKEFRNPEFSRLIASGVPIIDPNNDDGGPVVVFEEDPFSPSFGKSFVARGLKKTLESIETDLSIFQTEPDGLSLNVPNVLSALESNSSHQKIKLKMENSNNKDVLNLSVEDVNFDGTSKQLFAFRESFDLDESIKTFIQRKNLHSNQIAQKELFGDFISSVWLNGADVYENGQKIERPSYSIGPKSINSTLIKTQLKQHFINERFVQIFRDVFSSLAVQVSKSPLFKAEIISLVDFVSKSKECHILKIEKIKNKMKEQHENSDCDENFFPVVDGLGRNTRSPLEQAGIDGIIRTIVRLIVLENFLRSIFLFSEFKFDDFFKQEKLLTQFLLIRLRQELQKFGNDFETLFFEQMLESYNNSIKNGIINAPFSREIDVAAKFFIDDQIIDVFEDLIKLVGFKNGSLDLSTVLIEKWLPVFDVHDETDLRFVSGKPKSLNELTQVAISDRENEKIIFSLENGQFILEKYLRVDDKKSSYFSDPKTNGGRSDALFGIVNPKKFEDYIKNFDFGTKRVSFEQNFEKVSYGLRLVYVPPLVPNDFNAIIEENELFEEILLNAKNSKDARNKDKSFDLVETIALEDSQTQKILHRRKVHSFPVVSVEIVEDLTKISAKTSFSTKYLEQLPKLITQLKETQEIQFLFKFIFPIHRMFSLGLLFSNLYLSNISAVRELFSGTKQSLKTVFDALQNVGNYQFSDQITDGGDLFSKSQSNTDTNPQIPGTSVAAMAAKTPFLILKGITEVADPNIAIAKKIVDKAKDDGKNLPIQGVSLGLLPSNVFPPPIGIGPPLTFLGFVYLGLDLDGIFNSAKGKELRQEEAKKNQNFDVKSDCEEEE